MRTGPNWGLSAGQEKVRPEEKVKGEGTGINCAVIEHTEAAISRSISECQSNESGEFAISVQQILRYLF